MTNENTHYNEANERIPLLQRPSTWGFESQWSSPYLPGDGAQPRLARRLAVFALVLSVSRYSFYDYAPTLDVGSQRRELLLEIGIDVAELVWCWELAQNRHQLFTRRDLYVWSKFTIADIEN